MAREPFNLPAYLHQFDLLRYASQKSRKSKRKEKERKDFPPRGIVIEDAKKKKTGQIPLLAPPLLKKKNILRIHFHPILLVDDPDNLAIMVARPPGQSDVIRARKFHGHRLPSATSGTRDVSFYDP